MREESSTDAMAGDSAESFAAAPDPAVVCTETEEGWVVRATNDAFDRAFDAPVSPGDPATALPGAEAFADGLPTAEHPTVELPVGDENRAFSVRAAPAGVVVYADVTDLRRDLERTRAQRDRLDDFAGLLAHDLRNPLEVAMSRTELARELGGDEHLEKTETALERIEEVVTELLELAREGAVVGETELRSLADVARDAWSTVATGDATLTVTDDLTVEGDSGRVRELLENLFRNCVDHAGEAPAVVVGAVTDDGDPIGLYVADDGPGVPPDEREDVFKPGFSTAEEGTGFGLTVVDRVAAGHGWEVTVDESADGGARFEVVDPARSAFSSD
jgi:signal transduction histidine kinase